MGFRSCRGTPSEIDMGLPPLPSETESDPANFGIPKSGRLTSFFRNARF